MGSMNVTILGRDYSIACDDGQEAHLGKLAHLVNERLHRLARDMGRGPESTMLMYAALMLADELVDAKTELEMISKGEAPRVSTAKLQEMETAMADSMNHIAERIEQLSQQLETI